MSEIGDGGYKYNFTSYNSYKDYFIRCDGGDSLYDSDRYTYGVNDFVSLNEMENSLDDADASIG